VDQNGVDHSGLKSPVAVPTVRRAALAFIFVTVLLDILAIGIVIPVLPHLVERFLGGDTARAALWIGGFGTAFALAQFIFSPVQGALSDRFGRRPVILLSNAGLCLDFVLMAVVNTLPLLFLGRVLAGVCSASISTANAYIADVVPAERRAASFGMLGAAFGIGFIIGPALGGVLGGIDLRLPFWVAAALSGLNFLYGLMVLPESLPVERRRAFEVKSANPLGALRLLRSYPQVGGLVIANVLSQLAHYVLPAVFVLYAGYRYGWGQDRVGYVLALVGVCNVIVQAVLMRRLVARFGERRCLLAGLLFGSAGFVLQALASTGPMFLLAVPLLALWGLAGRSSQALITRQVAQDHQGRLQGALTSAVSLTGVFGPATFASVFAASIAVGVSFELPGAAFLLAAVLLLLAAGCVWRSPRTLWQPSSA